jgi:hypothetical protein
MVYHVLNGDALADKFPSEQIEGQLIVIREAFVEGPLALDLSPEFWEKRIAFLNAAYKADKIDYEHQFFTQLALLDRITDNDEVCLWFEDDLFCIVNMWFVVNYISKRSGATLYRIFPKADNKTWIGFADTNDFEANYQGKVKFEEEDVELTNQLWESYVNNDVQKLKALSHSDSGVYRYLPEVVQAHIDRTKPDGELGRPQQTLVDILNQGKTDFYDIYEAFWKKESIYGFGDMQVYNMLREMEVDISEL